MLLETLFLSTILDLQGNY